jgi:kinetochor protein Mis14/NSL1
MRREEDLLEEIAALKREVPIQAAANWREALKSGIEADEASLKNASREGDADGVSLDLKPLERREEVEATWRRGVEGLERLKREMPGKTARMERAKRAAEYTLAEEKEKKAVNA